MKNILLLMMGGKGTRFGADIPKQYIEVNSIPIFAYILKKYSLMDEIDDIIVVSHQDWISFVNQWIKTMNIGKIRDVVQGGDTRSGSVLNGLTAASKFADKDDVVLIHDATHPYVDVEGTKKVIEGVREYGGATLAQFQYDTMYRKSDDDVLIEVVPRKEIVSGASPEAFRFGEIFKIYSETPEEKFEIMTSAGAIALANRIKMKVIESNVVNLKITYQKDMKIFKKLALTYFFEEE
ncbi:MAG: IspD/TarI family cytidylyltransferase [Anaerovoracaceae bacterium]|jgi:2-C-methyl-D-erythritol 4-phosphate cytidylyltransferase